MVSYREKYLAERARIEDAKKAPKKTPKKETPTETKKEEPKKSKLE